MVTGQVTLCLEGVEKSHQLKIYLFAASSTVLWQTQIQETTFTNGFLVGENKMDLWPRTSWATARLNEFLVSSPTAVVME